MVIGTGTANATRSRQTFGGSPAVPGQPSSDSGSRYVAVPVETFLEELPNKRLEFGSPRSLLGNSPSTSGTINLPVPLSGEKDSPGLSAGWNDVEGPEAQTVRSDAQVRIAGLPDYTLNDNSHQTINQALKYTPGYGESFAQCGEPKFKMFCPENKKHYVRTIRHTCHRPACPVCYRGWAAVAMKRAVSTIEGYRTAHGYSRLPRHFSVNIPFDMVPYDKPGPDALVWLMDTVRDALKLAGARAVAAIPHPYRIKPEYKKIAAQFALASGQNRYEWVLNQANWSDLVYFSPHVHILVYGKLLDGVVFELLTGLILVNHDENNPAGRDEESLKKTVFYLLTHAWVRDNEKAVRYWFGMSAKSLGCLVDKGEKVPMPCPVPECPGIIRKVPPPIVQEDGSTRYEYQDPRQAPMYYTRTPYRHYFVRVKVKRLRAHKRISARSSAIWGLDGPPGLVGS